MGTERSERQKTTRRGIGAMAVLLTAHAFISSASGQDKIFPADAVINVALPPYDARPDDGIDDTAAIQRAVSDHVGTGRTLYFPAGTYDLSQPIVAKNHKGLWDAHLTLQGQGRDKSILKLKDNAAGFTDPAKPQAVYSSGSHWQEGDDPTGGGNKAFRNNVFDLTIDTGRGNGGAIGIEWAVSNQGTIRDVTVRSGDGGGIAGISMCRRIPGPGYIKDVTVEGFDAGIDVKDIQYGFTLEDVTVKGQRVAGIRLHDNLLHIRRLTSENTVPTIIATGANSALTVIDARLKGGVPDALAIDAAGTTLLRLVSIDGYRADAAVRLRGSDIKREDLLYIPPDHDPISARKVAYGEQASPTILQAESVVSCDGVFGAMLEAPEFDEMHLGPRNLDDWIAVGPRLDGETDDTAAIQRAMDSGKSTIYFINDRVYFLSDTVVVRGPVQHVFGFGAEISLGAARDAFSNVNAPRPLFRIDRTKDGVIVFDRMFFNAQYPGQVLFENNERNQFVVRHSMGWIGANGSRRTYRNTERAAGARVFIEDCFLPGWQFTKQEVGARQLNPENYDGDGTTSQVTNIGGRLWILGFKTEGPAPFITTTDRGMTELLGGYNYINATQLPAVPTDAVPYVVKDSVGSFTFVSENFRDNDYPVYIRDQQGNDVTDVRGTDLPGRNGNPADRSRAVPLYRTRTPAE